MECFATWPLPLSADVGVKIGRVAFLPEIDESLGNNRRNPVAIGYAIQPFSAETRRTDTGATSEEITLRMHIKRQ